MSFGGCVFGRVGALGKVFEIGRGAKQDGVATRGLRGQNALILDPSGSRSGRSVLAELGLFVAERVGNFGVGEHLDPGSVVLDDHEFVAGQHFGNLGGGVVGIDVDDGGVNDGGAGGEIVAGFGALLVRTLLS